MRRVLVVLLAVGCLALLGLGAARLLARDPDPEPRPKVALPTVAPGTSTTTGRADPGRGDPGVHVQVTPREDGTLDVVEEIRFLGASTGLQVALPEVNGLRTDARPRAPRITDLEVLADGHLLPKQEGSIGTGGRVLLPNAPLAVELHYTLTGAATMSARSTPGRALVLLPPIAADDSLKKLPVVVEVSGSGVRNLVCPGLAPDDQLCGRQTATGWRTVFLSTRATAVLAQLDLSRY